MVRFDFLEPKHSQIESTKGEENWVVLSLERLGDQSNGVQWTIRVMDGAGLSRMRHLGGLRAWETVRADTERLWGRAGKR